MPSMWDWLSDVVPAGPPPSEADDASTYGDEYDFDNDPMWQALPFAFSHSPGTSKTVSRAATSSPTLVESSREPTTSCEDTSGSIAPASSSGPAGVTSPKVQGVSSSSEDLPLPVHSESLACELATTLGHDTSPGDVNVNPRNDPPAVVLEPTVTAGAVAAPTSVHADEEATRNHHNDGIAAAEEEEVDEVAAEAQGHEDAAAGPQENEEEPEEDELAAAVPQNDEAAAAPQDDHPAAVVVAPQTGGAVAATAVPCAAATIVPQDAAVAVVVAAAVPHIGVAAVAVPHATPTAGAAAPDNDEDRWLLHGTAAAQAAEQRAAARLTASLCSFQLDMLNPDAQAAGGAANVKKAKSRKVKATAKDKAAPPPDGELRATNPDPTPHASRAPAPASAPAPPQARRSRWKNAAPAPAVPQGTPTPETAFVPLYSSRAASFAPPPPPLVAPSPAHIPQFVPSPQSLMPATAAGFVPDEHLARVHFFVATDALSPSTMTDNLDSLIMDADGFLLLKSFSGPVLVELLLGLSDSATATPDDLAAVEYQFTLNERLIRAVFDAVLEHTPHHASAPVTGPSQGFSFGDGYGDTPAPRTTTAPALEHALPAASYPTSPGYRTHAVGPSMPVHPQAGPSRAPARTEPARYFGPHASPLEVAPVGVRKRGRAPDDALERAGASRPRRFV